MSALRLFVLDGHDLVRDGVRMHVQAATDVELVGEADTVSEGTRELSRLRPDVVLLEVLLPDGSGIDVVRGLVEAGLPTRSVVFTADDSQEMLREAWEAGATCFLPKHADSRLLLAMVRTAAQAGATAASTTPADGRGAPAVRSASSLEDALPGLTPQARRVAAMLAEGATDREIGERLAVSVRTARHCVSRVLADLGLRNRTEAAVHVALRTKDGVTGRATAPLARRG